MAPHPFLRPIDGADSRGMPAPPGETRRVPSRADTWARLEYEAVTEGRQPRPVQGPWAAAVERIWLPATERIRAYAGPASATIEVLLQCGATDDEVARAVYSTDAGLQHLRRHMLQLSSDLRMWSELHARYPGVRRALKRVARESPLTADLPAVHEDGWPDAALAMLTFGSPERIIGWADSVLSTDEGQMAVAILVAALWEHLSRLRECAVKYYGVPSSDAALSELDASLLVACVAALVLCEPSAVQRARVSDVVERPALMYFLDTAAVVLYQLLRLLGHVPQARPLSDIEDDRVFALLFEREWEVLLPFTNGFFGFAVVPRLSYEDMVRYHRLRYAPYGDLASIPYEVGDYLVHQAKGSMHFLRPFLPDHLQDAFYDCVRPLFERLIFTHQKQIADALLRSEDGPYDAAEALEQAEQPVEDAFRTAYEGYDFYQHPPGGPTPTLSGGVIGWHRRDDLKELARELGLAEEPPRTPFAAYALGHLKRHLYRTWRKLGLYVQGRNVTGPHGRSYYTASRLAMHCQCTADAIRRLDDVLDPVRVRDVFRGQEELGVPDLPASTRLYPADREFVERVRSLLSIPSGVDRRLAGDDECTRAAFARRQDLSVWRLITLERRGVVTPRREGRFVVYDAKQRRIALAHLKPASA